MVTVFLPALILEVFTIYSILKIFTLNMIANMSILRCIDFIIWNMCLVVPSLYAIYIGAEVPDKVQTLMNYIGKVSNYCTNDSSLQRVCDIEQI